MNSQCPCCEGTDRCVVYTAPPGPAQTTLMLESADEARSALRGAVELVLCRSCGFLANDAHDLSLVEHSDRTECSQAFSGTYMAYARSMVERWSAQFGLPGKTVVEIGAGRGDFIRLLCEQARCRGIAFDPALPSEPTTSPEGLGVEYRRENFGPGASTLAFDFVVSRHVLEHIPPVLQFLKMVRGALGQRRIGLGFDLPGATRILHEGAFWDVYHEHCNYFTPGSLARVFRRAGFDVLDVRREFEGNFLMLEALPGDGSGGALPIEESPETVGQWVRDFTGKVQQSVRHWRRRLSDVLSAGGRFVAWGAGSKFAGFQTLVPEAQQASAVVDINPRRQGLYQPVTATPIVSPESLRELRPELVVVMNPVYLQEITRHISELGLTPKVDAL